MRRLYVTNDFGQSESSSGKLLSHISSLAVKLNDTSLSIRMQDYLAAMRIKPIYAIARPSERMLRLKAIIRISELEKNCFFRFRI